MRTRFPPAISRICRIVFHGAGPAGPGWVNYVLVEAARRAGAHVFPPSAGWILPLFFSGLWERTEGVALFGYSRGGVSAVRLARFLAKERIRVVLLYLIDPITFCGRLLSIPSWVEHAFCCRQRAGARFWLLRGRLGRGTPCRVEGARSTVLEEEVVDSFPDGRPLRHEDMIRYALDYARLPLEQGLTCSYPKLAPDRVEPIPQLVSQSVERP